MHKHTYDQVTHTGRPSMAETGALSAKGCAKSNRRTLGAWMARATAPPEITAGGR